MWSRNRANLYIRDALAEFEPDYKLPAHSPPAQHRIYKNRLMVNHLVGFGGGGVAPLTGTSYAFDGTGDWLGIPDHADFDLTGDLTIECFVRPSSNVAGFIFAHWEDASNKREFNLQTNGRLKYRVTNVGSTNVNFQTGDVFNVGTWHHVAITRENDDYDFWVDGVDTGDGVTDSDAVSGIGGSIFIGQLGNGTEYLHANIDELRVSDIARYTTGFTPSAVAYTSDANTQLLIHCDETIVSGTTGSGATFTDSGNTGHTVTENGDAQRDIVTYKF